jgi:CO/xanthine dehydrogenase FAD-binding subunit
VLGGGLYINEVIKDPIAVVDIQALDLAGINKKGKNLQIGAAAKLQALLDDLDLPAAVKEAVKHQETNNRRQVATMGGVLVAAGGRSSVAGAFLALDAILETTGPDLQVENVHLGEYLPLRDEKTPGRLIKMISIPLDVKMAYHYVARSPADLPIVGAFTAVWPSGRTRVVLIGYGDQPVMVFDAPDGDGADIAARDAYSEASDQWASSEYRSDIAGILVRRCLDEVTEK